MCPKKVRRAPAAAALCSMVGGLSIAGSASLASRVPAVEPTTARCTISAARQPRSSKGASGRSVVARRGQSLIAAASHARVAEVLPKRAKKKARPSSGVVTLRYNAKTHEVPVVLGTLTVAAIDAKFCFSAVFRGNFVITLHAADGTVLKPSLIVKPAPQQIGTAAAATEAAAAAVAASEGSEVAGEDAPTVQPWRTARPPKEICGVVPGSGEYAVVIVEDAKAEAEVETRAFTAAGAGGTLASAGGGDVDQFGGEDASSCSCIYGNPCVSAYSCLDWRNRYEVARAHGWKSGIG